MNDIFSPKALKLARAKARISQSELGRRSGINPAQINRYEKGRSVPRAETVGAIADSLEIDPDELYVETK